MIHFVVIDTNLLLSGTFYGGVPSQLVNLVLTSCLRLVISQPLIDELREKLTRRFQRTEEQADQIINDLLKEAYVASPEQQISVCRDPDDDRILECAVAGRAEAIITGDKDLLVLNPFEGIEILTARQFLERARVQIP